VSWKRTLATLPWLVAVLALAGCGVSSEVSRAVGARCDDMSDCDDRCLPPSDYAGGFCSLSCETTEDCPTDATCLDREGGVCMFRCMMAGDCRFLGEGWTCVSEPTRSDVDVEVSACVPL